MPLPDTESLPNLTFKVSTLLLEAIGAFFLVFLLTVSCLRFFLSPHGAVVPLRCWSAGGPARSDGTHSLKNVDVAVDGARMGRPILAVAG